MVSATAASCERAGAKAVNIIAAMMVYGFQSHDVIRCFVIQVFIFLGVSWRWISVGCGAVSAFACLVLRYRLCECILIGVKSGQKVGVTYISRCRRSATAGSWIPIRSPPVRISGSGSGNPLVARCEDIISGVISSGRSYLPSPGLPALSRRRLSPTVMSSYGQCKGKSCAMGRVGYAAFQPERASSGMRPHVAYCPGARCSYQVGGLTRSIATTIRCMSMSTSSFWPVPVFGGECI